METRKADNQQVTPVSLLTQKIAQCGASHAKNALKVPVNEVAAFQDKKLQKEMEKLNKKPIDALEKQILEAAAALLKRGSMN